MSFEMPRGSRQRSFDPDLDLSRGHDPRSVEDVTRGYARLLVNPFLAMLGGILACSIMKIGLKARDPILSLAALLGMIASVLLIQYHCLDCSVTGWIFHARRHLCPLAAERSSRSNARRLRWPSIWAQLKFWLALVIAAGCYYLLTTAAGRR